MLVWILFGIAVALAAIKLYKLTTINADCFTKQNIKFIKPTLLSSSKVWLSRVNLMDYVQELYNTFPGEKIIGLFDVGTPLYMVRDPKLLKQLTIKEFDNFQDHRNFISADLDDLFGNSLFTMTEDKWRDMRATLSPAFTGSKMRVMFDLVAECSDQMAKYFVKMEQQNGRQIHEMKDIFSRFSNDVIATCAFGIEVHSNEDKDNEFYLTGKRLTNFSRPGVMLKFIIYRFMPSITKYFKLNLMDSSDSKFFCSLIRDTMIQREQQSIVRPDMINILMQLKKGNLAQSDEKVNNETEGFATVEESQIGKRSVKREWTDKEIYAQCFLFFLAGFDTSSTALTFITHEIACNPEVQSKLLAEVDAVCEELNGKPLTYEHLLGLKYMDMVITEALRKWPPAPVADRQCGRDFVFENDDGMKIEFKKGDILWLPYYGFHRDPKYYPNPDQFDPERFNDENKANIDPATYLPFGIGPRNCIGSRFALMVLKSVIFYFLKSFTFEPCEKTQIPLRLSKAAFTVKTEKGVWLELRPRKKLNK